MRGLVACDQKLHVSLPLTLHSPDKFKATLTPRWVGSTDLPGARMGRVRVFMKDQVIH